MISSRSLAILRDLQALREQRCQAQYATALRSERNAKAETEKAEASLAAQNHALEHYASQGELQIEQFQILARLLTQSEAELQLRREAHKETREREANARQARVRAEKQSDQLAELHAKARGKERRKEEDRRALEFLSQAAASKGAKS